MLTTAEQFRILAKMIEDLYELKKNYSYLYTCGKSVPDDYRNAVNRVMENAKGECGGWGWDQAAQERLYWEVWNAFYRVSTPIDSELIRHVLRKKLEIDIGL